MKAKHLAMRISKLKKIYSPRIELEQYTTPGDLVAKWVIMASNSGDLDSESIVLDLGCGNGALGLGALIYGAKKAIMVDKDPDSLLIMEQNSRVLKVKDRVTTIQADVSHVGKIGPDLVFCNPPWGTQLRGADRPFLEKIKELNSVSYILHSSSSNHIEKIFQSWNWSVVELFSHEFPLGSSYSHHKKMRGSTSSTLWRLTPPDITGPDRS